MSPINKILIQVENADKCLDLECQSPGVRNERIYGKLEAVYDNSRRELIDMLDVLTGGLAERIVEALRRK